MKIAINIICYQLEILRSQGLQLKVNGENLKVKFVRRLLYYVLALLKSTNMDMRDVINMCGDYYFFWRRCNYSIWDM